MKVKKIKNERIASILMPYAKKTSGVLITIVDKFVIDESKMKNPDFIKQLTSQMIFK